MAALVAEAELQRLALLAQEVQVLRVKETVAEQPF
jgi:hypothetical protein